MHILLIRPWLSLLFIVEVRLAPIKLPVVLAEVGTGLIKPMSTAGMFSYV